MQRTVSIAEARAAFAELVREVESGEPIAIARHGRVVAGVVSADDLAAVRARRHSRVRFGSGWIESSSSSPLTKPSMT
jgi:prevent-host-death family protein